MASFKSEVDLTQIRGTCTNIRKTFEESDETASSVHPPPLKRRTSCSDMRSIWEDHMNNKAQHAEDASARLLPTLPNQAATAKAKTLFSSGELSQATVRSFVEDRSVTSSRVKFDPEEAVSTPSSYNSGTRAELEALRQSSVKTSPFKLDRPPGSGLLKRSLSSAAVSGEKVLDLDDETMEELSVANSMIKAMFESSAPKYRYGGGGGAGSIEDVRVNQANPRTSGKATRSQCCETFVICSNVSDIGDFPGPVMRPSVRAKEERKWVVDTIHKYFDVIVEEEDEPEDEDTSSIMASDLSSPLSSEDEEEEKEPADFKSTAKMRGMLSQVLNKNAPPQANKSQMLTTLKQKLGSQISLKRMSKENLSGL